MAIAGAGEREAVVAHLRPGDNYVSWISDSRPIQSLFDELPQIELIWAWNASRQQFTMAAPGLPRRLWTLDTLEPGMGVIVRLSGVHAVEWTRERADADPVVELDAGYNLVASMGDDHTALNQALSGIGPPLRGARVWSADGDTTVHEVGEDLQRESPSLPVAHGTALWVNVDRATFWLQSVLRPTHIHWFTHPDINSDRNKQGTAIIKYGGNSFYQLISRLSIEGCEVINLQIDGTEYDFRHTNAQNSAFEDRFDTRISAGTQAVIQCVDHCDIIYAGSDAPDYLVRHIEEEVPRCVPLQYRPGLIKESSDCRTDWPEPIARLFLQIPVFQDLCWIESLATARGFAEVGRLGAVPANVGFVGEGVVLSQLRPEIYLVDHVEIDLDRARWTITMIHEVCHIHQNWYVLKRQITDSYLNETPYLVAGSPRNAIDIWHDTDMAREFIELSGFTQQQDGMWKLSGAHVKGRDSHVTGSPKELSADVCALYMAKQLSLNQLRGYERYTKPPYLTEELEAWVEQYVVLPQ